jgi:hypothetical protein
MDMVARGGLSAPQNYQAIGVINCFCKIFRFSFVSSNGLTTSKEEKLTNVKLLMSKRQKSGVRMICWGLLICINNSIIHNITTKNICCNYQNVSVTNIQLIHRKNKKLKVNKSTKWNSNHQNCQWERSHQKQKLQMYAKPRWGTEIHDKHAVNLGGDVFKRSVVMSSTSDANRWHTRRRYHICLITMCCHQVRFQTYSRRSRRWNSRYNDSKTVYVEIVAQCSTHCYNVVKKVSGTVDL